MATTDAAALAGRDDEVRSAEAVRPCAATALASLEALCERMTVRRRSGVYLLLRRSVVVYVGASRNVDLRIHGHASRIRFDAAIVRELPQSKMWLHERALIYALLPEHNTKIQDIGERERRLLRRLGVAVVDEAATRQAIADRHEYISQSMKLAHRRRNSP